MKSYLIAGVAMLMVAGTAGADDTKDEVRALSQAQHSLPEAIQTVERAGSGKAVDVEIETDDNQLWYDIDVLSKDGKKLTEYRVSASTGKIEKTTNEPVEKLVTRVKPQELHSAPTSLTAAIRSAEQKTGGKVVGAATEGSGESLRYELKIAMADGDTDEIQVDSATGRML